MDLLSFPEGFFTDGVCGTGDLSCTPVKIVDFWAYSLCKGGGKRNSGVIINL